MTSETESAPAPPQAGKAGLKLLLELGPLVLFFVLNAKFGIIVATEGFLIAIAIALPMAWRLERKMPVMSVLSAIFVGGLGGLTIWLEDSTFIKLKPTIFSVFLALALLGGLMRGKYLLAHLFGATLKMDEAGWRILTVRWAIFFLGIAVINEIVWRSVSTDTWVSFKVFGLLPLTLVFTISQLGLMKRHELVTPESEE